MAIDPLLAPGLVESWNLGFVAKKRVVEILNISNQSATSYETSPDVSKRYKTGKNKEAWDIYLAQVALNLLTIMYIYM